MSADGFAVDWLKERFNYDNAARNDEVEQAFLYHFRSKEKLYLVDIGSGTGANCLYFMERLFKHQDWTLIEKDAKLCEATKRRIERFLQDYNFFYNYADNVFRIKIWEYRVKITINNASFFDLERLVDLSATDVVLAAAVFDVLTAQQTTQLLETIFQSETSLLTTMNYAAMRLLPATAIDQQMVKAYEAHMLRQQAHGVALGSEVSEFLITFFKKNNQSFQSGESPWRLDRRSKRMHQYLLDFMRNAIGETTTENAAVSILENWYADRSEKSREGALDIEVDHMDFFVA